MVKAYGWGLWECLLLLLAVLPLLLLLLVSLVRFSALVHTTQL